MSKRQIIMICGVLVALIPFIGFPNMWDTLLSVVLGLLIVGIAYRMSPSSISTSTAVPFVEHTTTPVEVKNEQKIETNQTSG